ncbi:kinase-like domain-containing protein [Hypoxylon trugodes]|uniref:kinase-like domain-containing protein n=1 Tax=Hypoxylon trugodes TaxID=326681 RepID=UPI00219C4448|nr:kinase-like domain-containing protein [Hypoxylon trugodes]KAI1387874.1 kinase-like domain-containing protein [Hypoxylon trugodes]
MVLPGEMNVRSETVQKARQLLSTFRKKNEQRFKFEYIIGEGSHGFTTRFKARIMEVDESGPPLSVPKIERFVMKRSILAHEEHLIQREIDVLGALQDSEHIQQLYWIKGEPRASYISYVKGPSLLTHWVENGTLLDMIQDRLPEWNGPLPNRLLWGVFFCLVRMLVAMAWDGEERPPRDSSGQPLPETGRVHGDFQSGNILIGDFDPDEHSLFPGLVLFDFGSSNELSDGKPPSTASKTNIFNAGRVMIELIGGTVKCSGKMKIDTEAGEETIQSYARDLDGLNSVYKVPTAIANRQKQKLANLDPDLRSLIARCLANDIKKRPNLEDLYDEVERNVEEKQQKDYAGKASHKNESNGGVRNVAKELMVLQDIKSSLSALQINK